MRQFGLAISFALCLAGCANQAAVTYWEKNKKTKKIVVHHITRSFGRVHDRTEELSAKVVTPSEIHVYDVGRLPDGNGGMSEAHRYYRVVQSEHFDLRLPETGKGWKYAPKPTGPKKMFYAPTYTPPPQSERITDAVSRAQDKERQAVAAKKQLEDATGRIRDRLNEDNNLRQELQNEMEANEELKRQIDKGVDGSFSARHAPATSAVPEPPKDPLAQWGTQIQQNSQ
jgi:hypothetical protein